MIYGRHSVLKRGCSTWNQELQPREEFKARLEAARGEMAQLGLDALAIYGDNYHFADLCYLTNYFPKVRGGIGLVPRAGDLTLLLNIGSRDVPFAKTLTWVDDVRASNLLGADAAKLIKEKKLEGAKLGWVDAGRGFPLPQFEEMRAALSRVGWVSCDHLVARLRQQKSGRELVAMRAAGRLLQEICEEAANCILPGRKEFEVIADIDRLARVKGAEDIRILAGETHLEPPGAKSARPLGKHWALHLAVQHERYWAEAGRTYIIDNSEAADRAYVEAREFVERMVQGVKAGQPAGAIEQTARQVLAEPRYATAAQYGFGQGIGLSQREAPFLTAADAREAGVAVEPVNFAAGMTVALRVAFETGGKFVIYGDSYEVTSGGPRCLG
jgi:Xaa-Pro aminopeptidase